ncbi:S8 family serine peptidase [Nitrosopumilus sp. K4]|uniref:S8 family serine peptidase n=1 Tax=Nitrosopumilus sp. K4 TaxID=2795383 RepID=UPI001BADC006|nr:S8 family serine peptidase [Nitrosopumilus sp. K4]QUC65531.1 S8 family serine peptidase [Nitrosopumilus sp. K4]
MNILYSVILSTTLLFSIFTISESFAMPDSDWVYLIPSHEQGLKNMFGVRHNFDTGFTATLNDHQVTALQKAGLNVEKIYNYQLLAPPGACEPWPSCKNGDGGDSGGSDPARIATPSSQIPWGINSIYNIGEDDFTPSGGLGVKVAVLDSGVDVDHIDLVSRIVDCKDFTKIDRKTGGPKENCDDRNGHGTHVAGTIMADGGFDGNGIFGIAPESELMAYKVCGGGGCWGDDIATAIITAHANGADIISMSLGADGQSSVIRDAIFSVTEAQDALGADGRKVLVIAAAGNDGPNIGTIDYPGANSNVVAVGALDENHNVANFSSRGINNGDYQIGEREVYFAAPGVSVYSTINDGTYGTKSGTSMATPHVSGLAAKVWQGSADATLTYLENLSFDFNNDGDDPASGFGLPRLP